MARLAFGGSPSSSPLCDFVAIERIANTIMLNSFQHLMESGTYKTLNQVQGDKIVIPRQSLGGEGRGDM